MFQIGKILQLIVVLLLRLVSGMTPGNTAATASVNITASHVRPKGRRNKFVHKQKLVEKGSVARAPINRCLYS